MDAAPRIDLAVSAPGRAAPAWSALFPLQLDVRLLSPARMALRPARLRQRRIICYRLKLGAFPVKFRARLSAESRMKSEKIVVCGGGGVIRGHLFGQPLWQGKKGPPVGGETVEGMVPKVSGAGEFQARFR